MKPPKDVGLNPAALRVVQEGLYDAALPPRGRNVGEHLLDRAPGADAGKTATAEFVRTRATPA